MALKDMVQTPDDRPVIMTICGDAGVGKTRLAATFPNPIFIRAEDGMQSIPRAERPAAFPLLASYPKPGDGVAALFDQLLALLKEDHDYKTLVIDSVTALDVLFTAEALLAVPETLALEQLQARLETLADDLMVELNLRAEE